MHDDFEFREDGGIRRKDRDGARSHAGDRKFRHDQPLGQSADNNTAEKNRGEMPGTDNRLDLAPGEKQQQHAGQQVQRIVVDQRKGEKSPVIARVDAGAVEGQPAKEEILPAVAVTEEKLGGHLRTERPDAQRDQERRGRGTPRRPRPDECLELAAGVAHAGSILGWPRWVVKLENSNAGRRVRVHQKTKRNRRRRAAISAREPRASRP